MSKLSDLQTELLAEVLGDVGRLRDEVKAISAIPVTQGLTRKHYLIYVATVVLSLFIGVASCWLVIGDEAALGREILGKVNTMDEDELRGLLE